MRGLPLSERRHTGHRDSPGPRWPRTRLSEIDAYDRYGRWITWRQGPGRTGCYPWSYNTVPSISVYWDIPASRCD